MKKLLTLLAICVMAVTSAFADATVVTTTEALQAAVNAGGEVQLGGDIDLTATISVPNDKTVTLDLNGHVLNAGNLAAPTASGDADACVIHNKGTLNIIDSNSSNAHTDWNTNHPTSAGNADLSAVKGGVLTGGKGSNAGSIVGGAIRNEGSDADLSITGVTITGNKAQMAGGILTTGKNLTLKGTTISKNSATVSFAGGIYLYGPATISECTITDNTCTQVGGAGIALVANATLNGKNNFSGNTMAGENADIVVMEGCYMTLGTDFETTSPIGVTILNSQASAISGKFTTNGSATDAAYFTSDNSSYEVKYNAAGYLETTSKPTTLDFSALNLTTKANVEAAMEKSENLTLSETASGDDPHVEWQTPGNSVDTYFKFKNYPITIRYRNSSTKDFAKTYADCFQFMVKRITMTIICEAGQTIKFTPVSYSKECDFDVTGADVKSISIPANSTDPVTVKATGPSLTFTSTDACKIGKIEIYDANVNISSASSISISKPDDMTDEDAQAAVKKVLNSNTSAASVETGLSDAIDASKVSFEKETDPATVQYYLDLVCKSATVSNESGAAVVTAMAFDATPMATATGTDGNTYTTKVPDNAITGTITFRLPVDKNATNTDAQVTHKTAASEQGGQMSVTTAENGDKYIETTTTSSSADSYELKPVGVAQNTTTNTNYATVQKAIAAVKAGETIQLTNDVDLEYVIYVSSSIPAFTLDLNGHVLNAGNLTGDYAYIINNSGTMKITDSNPTATHTQTGLTDVKGGVLTGGKGQTYDGYSYGGAIMNYGTLTMTAGTIYKNSASCGGGIYNYGTCTLNGVAISNNSATWGGGIYNYYATCTLNGVAISNNSASNIGGGVNNNYGTCELKDCVISGNNSEDYTGGIANYGTMTMTGGSVTGNSANVVGGIDNEKKATLYMKNVTVSGNTATAGPGGINNNLYLTLDGCTVTGNSSVCSEPTGGMYCAAHYGGTVTLKNKNIIKDNTTAIDGKVVKANLILSGETAPQQAALDNIAGSEIGVTTLIDGVVAEGQFTTATATEADLKWFTADNAACEVLYNAEGKYLETYSEYLAALARAEKVLADSLKGDKDYTNEDLSYVRNLAAAFEAQITSAKELAGDCNTTADYDNLAKILNDNTDKIEADLNTQMIAIYKPIVEQLVAEYKENVQNYPTNDPADDEAFSAYLDEVTTFLKGTYTGYEVRDKADMLLTTALAWSLMNTEQDIVTLKELITAVSNAIELDEPANELAEENLDILKDVMAESMDLLEDSKADYKDYSDMINKLLTAYQDYNATGDPVTANLTVVSDINVKIYKRGNVYGPEVTYTVGKSATVQVSTNNNKLLIVPATGKTIFVAVNGKDVTTEADGSVLLSVKENDDIVISETATTLVNSIQAGNSANTVRYNLNGQRINGAQKGIVILNGKKFVVK